MLWHCGPGAVPRQRGQADEGMRDGCSSPLARHHDPAAAGTPRCGTITPGCSMGGLSCARAVPNMCVPAQGHDGTMCGIISLCLWPSEQATEII